jgi:hypothetical protein
LAIQKKLLSNDDLFYSNPGGEGVPLGVTLQIDYYVPHLLNRCVNIDFAANYFQLASRPIVRDIIADSSILLASAKSVFRCNSDGT